MLPRFAAPVASARASPTLRKSAPLLSPGNPRSRQAQVEAQLRAERVISGGGSVDRLAEALAAAPYIDLRVRRSRMPHGGGASTVAGNETAGFSLLHRAAFAGRADYVRLIFSYAEAHALSALDVNAQTDLEATRLGPLPAPAPGSEAPRRHLTALMLAILSGSPDCVAALCAHPMVRANVVDSVRARPLLSLPVLPVDPIICCMYLYPSADVAPGVPPLLTAPSRAAGPVAFPLRL